MFNMLPDFPNFCSLWPEQQLFVILFTVVLAGIAGWHFGVIHGRLLNRPSIDAALQVIRGLEEQLRCKGLTYGEE